MIQSNKSLVCLPSFFNQLKSLSDKRSFKDILIIACAGKVSEISCLPALLLCNEII